MNKTISFLKLVSFRLTMYSNNTTALSNDTAAKTQIPLTIKDIRAHIAVCILSIEGLLLHLGVPKKLLFTYDTVTKRPLLFIFLSLVKITLCVSFVWGVTLENSSSRYSVYIEEITYTKRKFPRAVSFYHFLLISFLTIANYCKIRFVYRYGKEKMKKCWLVFENFFH